MGLETGTHISDLVITNPLSNDGLNESDNHHRLIKKVLKNSLADVDEEVGTIHAGTEPTTTLGGKTLWFDTSGGLLKLRNEANDAWITLSISPTDGSIEIVSDLSPQLGADLDTNSFNILVDDAHGIQDESGNEQIVFSTTGSAVNHIQVKNSATGTDPSITAIGEDTNIDLDLSGKGTGSITALTPLNLKSYTVATLPNVSPAGKVIYVSDEAGGGQIAFSDGTNFRRMSDRAIVS